MSADEHLYYEDEIAFYDERELELINLRGDLGVDKFMIQSTPAGKWNIGALKDFLEKEIK